MNTPTNRKRIRVWVSSILDTIVGQGCLNRVDRRVLSSTKWGARGQRRWKTGRSRTNGGNPRSKIP